MAELLSTIGLIIFFRYYGAKNNPKLMNAIQKLTPKHRIYIEPYMGSGGMCLNKKGRKLKFYLTQIVKFTICLRLCLTQQRVKY